MAWKAAEDLKFSAILVSTRSLLVGNRIGSQGEGLLRTAFERHCVRFGIYDVLYGWLDGRDGENEMFMDEVDG